MIIMSRRIMYNTCMLLRNTANLWTGRRFFLNFDNKCSPEGENGQAFFKSIFHKSRSRIIGELFTTYFLTETLPKATGRHREADLRTMRSFFVKTILVHNFLVKRELCIEFLKLTIYPPTNQPIFAVPNFAFNAMKYPFEANESIRFLLKDHF